MAQDIARHYGLKTSTVYSWTYRYDDFPAPSVSLGMLKGYDRAEVKRWVRAKAKRSVHGFARKPDPSEELQATIGAFPRLKVPSRDEWNRG